MSCDQICSYAYNVSLKPKKKYTNLEYRRGILTLMPWSKLQMEQFHEYSEYTLLWTK